MNIVTLADIATFLGFSLAFAAAVFGGRDRLDRPTHFFLCLCLFIYAFVGISNTLEHGGVTDYLDRYEDDLEILFVPSFLFFLFSLSTRRELEGREKAEAALRESERRFRELAEMLPEIVYEMDLDGRLTFVNHQAFELTGYDAQHFQAGFKPEQMIVPEDRERMHRNIAARLRGEGETGLEYTVVRKDGVRFPILAYSSPIVQEDGTVTGLRGILVDVSRAKSLEAQLVNAQKLEAVGTLAGGIAHDFNNILQGILGYLELVLVARALPDESRRHLQRARTACERASELVRGLLTFSRQQGPQLTTVDLNEEVRNVVSILERIIPKMIRLETRLHDELWPVRGDPLQIEQVLMNLGANARDAIEGEGAIAIRTENEVLHEPLDDVTELAAGRYVKLTFSDTGHGMEKAVLENMFDPFYTTKEVGKGTGLGLAIVYGIVRSHGGHIACQSAAGRGTIFSVYLPALEPGEAVSMHSVPAATPDREEAGTILVVDDEADVRDVSRTILEARGYRVSTARSGEEALGLYRERPDDFDLVILDLGMPGMGGRCCFEEMRRLDPEARVLVASGYAVLEIPADQQGRKADGYLPKPYRLDGLLRKVRELLSEVVIRRS